MRTFEIRRWAFTLSDEPEAWAKAYDDSSWRRITVPHDWSVEQEFSEANSSGTGYLPGGIGWYRAHVPLRDLGDLGGKHIRLRFDGVYKNARVWVNGYHLGGRPSGYAEFSFDLTEILSYATGDELVVSVRVEHTDISDSRWYNGSGINRSVALEVHEAVRVAEHGTAFTTLKADASAATIQITQVLVNGTTETLKVEARHELKSLTTGLVFAFTADAEVPAEGSASTEVMAEVEQPELWSDTNPQLYRLTTTVSWMQAGEERRAVCEETVGIRTFRFDADRGFSINGESRKLRGVCLHEDAGWAATPCGWRTTRTRPSSTGSATRSGSSSSTRRSTSGRIPRTSGGRGTTSTRRGTRVMPRTFPSGTSVTSGR
jgi:beta-galactosidase